MHHLVENEEKKYQVGKNNTFFKIKITTIRIIITTTTTNKIKNKVH